MLQFIQWDDFLLPADKNHVIFIYLSILFPMKKTTTLFFAASCLSVSLLGQKTANVSIDVNQPKQEISKHIYGHFAEHLGRCIYDGFWVSPDLNVEKQGRIRLDIVKALREIDIPNLRWPGGCYADEYQWRHGVGKDRPVTINSHWGGVTEDNSFGTHEFLELCELLDCDPYISANVGSGTTEQMRDWIEYLNFAGESTLSRQRAENGHPEPFKVSFWGIGNESWGCGGHMTPEYYSNLYRQYESFARNYSGNNLRKIACGPNGGDYNWMEVCMKNIPAHTMWGISLHHYTIATGNWGRKGSATDFEENEYFGAMKSCLHMEELLAKHTEIMDRYDRNRRVGLVVDEWGIWTDVEPGTNPGFLYQQNSMRDALIAGTTLNIFNHYSHRVRMANLAQTINVLQALVLTDQEKMLLTPTYHVFKMYKVHHDAKYLPLTLSSPEYNFGEEKLDGVNVSASVSEDGTVNISLVNLDPTSTVETSVGLNGFTAKKVKAEILTSKTYTDYNSFDKPNNIVPSNFKDFKQKGDQLTVKLPPLSVVVMSLN